MTRPPHLVVAAWIIAATAAGCTYTVDLSPRDVVVPSPETECICATWTATGRDTGTDSADTGPAQTVPCPC